MYYIIFIYYLVLFIVKVNRSYCLMPIEYLISDTSTHRTIYFTNCILLSWLS